MANNPESLTLYLEDLEYLKEILGPTTTIKVGNVLYKDFNEFKERYYNRKIKVISLKNNDGDEIELSSSGRTYVSIEDQKKSLEIKNFLFGKQPKVKSYLEKRRSFISKLWATFVIATFLYLVLVIKDKELNSKLFESSFGVVGLIFFPNLLFIVIPSKYAEHRIICRTSDDKQSIFRHQIFKEWVIPILTGIISTLFASILYYLWMNFK